MPTHLLIVNAEGNAMSHLKNNSPKILNSMLAACKTYDGWFGGKHRVIRFKKTPKGLVRI